MESGWETSEKSVDRKSSARKKVNWAINVFLSFDYNENYLKSALIDIMTLRIKCFFIVRIKRSLLAFLVSNRR